MAVKRARAESRPSGWQWASALCESWIELKGLDPVVRAGIATIDGRRMIMIANDRHAAAGRPTPKAYRLARRALKLADRLGLPFVSLVDTPGAEPGPESERGGIAFEIAKTFVAQAALGVPSVSLCVGEGGSGGALALSACDRLLILQDAVFSVIGPEGAAVILGRDAERAPEFARLLRLTAPELLELGAVDAVVANDIAAVRAALLERARRGGGGRPGAAPRRAHGAMASVGPPLRLYTHRERVRRRRVRVIAIAVLAGFSVLLTVVALNVATNPNADVQLGSTTFRVGHAATMVRRIRADNYPLLFQDLRNKSIDVFVSHEGTNTQHGWRAIEAHAPGAPRTCQLAWTGSGYTDPCDGTTFPPDGTGLRRFQVNVVDGVVYVNFRQKV